MANVYRHFRTGVAGVRPTGRPAGEVWLNTADGVLGYVNEAAEPVEVGFADALRMRPPSAAPEQAMEGANAALRLLAFHAAPGQTAAMLTLFDEDGLESFSFGADGAPYTRDADGLNHFGMNRSGATLWSPDNEAETTTSPRVYVHGGGQGISLAGRASRALPRGDTVDSHGVLQVSPAAANEGISIFPDTAATRPALTVRDPDNLADWRLALYSDGLIVSHKAATIAPNGGGYLRVNANNSHPIEAGYYGTAISETNRLSVSREVADGTGDVLAINRGGAGQIGQWLGLYVGGTKAAYLGMIDATTVLVSGLTNKISLTSNGFAARVDYTTATDLPHLDSIVTRSRGDARYAVRSSDTVFTAPVTAHQNLWVTAIAGGYSAVRCLRPGGATAFEMSLVADTDATTIRRRSAAGDAEAQIVFTVDDLQGGFLGTTIQSNSLLTRARADARYTQITSSARFKEDVRPFEAADREHSVLALNPRRFRWGGELPADEPARGRESIGLLAEEVLAVLPEAVIRDANGQVSGLDALVLIGSVIAELHRMDAYAAALREDLNVAQEDIAKLKSRSTPA